MSLGFCLSHRADMPSLPDRPICADCGHILIPPTWTRRDSPWPWPPQPSGWHWVQPTDATPRTSAPKKQAPRTDFEPIPGATTVALTCAWCKRVTQVVPRGGSPQRYCSIPCKDKATTAASSERKRAAKVTGGRACVGCGRGDRHLVFGTHCKPCRGRVVRHALRDEPAPRPCRECGDAYRPEAPPKGGPASPYCGDECRKAARRRGNAEREARRRGRKAAAA